MKLTSEQLTKYVLSHLSHRRNEVLLSASLGQDCSVIKTDKYVYLTTDPITASCSNVGTLAINICANDLAASGAECVAVLMTVIAPLNTTLDEISQVMADAEKVCNQYNIEIIGGHTEYSDAVNKLIVSCTAIGLSDCLQVNKVCDGDAVIVTKTLGLEQSAIESIDNPHKLGLTKQQLDIMADMINSTSVVKEGLLCRHLCSSMHDITEGGIIGAVNEIEEGLSVKLDVDYNLVPFHPLTLHMCDKLKLDKFTLYSSGSMLITTSKSNEVMEILANNGIKATIIGTLRRANK